MLHERALWWVDVLHEVLDNPKAFGKETREVALRELRKIERLLKLEPFDIKEN
jgi:hypothetical protein